MVGPGQRLVEQHQAVAAGLAENLAEAGQLLGQAAPAVVGAFFPGEMRINGVHRAEPGRGCRDRQPGLKKKLRLADGPGIGGFAAAIRPCNNKNVAGRRKINFVGDHLVLAVTRLEA